MGKVNRFTQRQASRYTPRTLQELMVAPAYKRKKHDDLDASIAEYETALAQFSGVNQHSAELQQEQQKLYEEMTAQRDKLNKEGFSKSSKSDFLGFNKKFQQAIGPQGKIGQINAAKADLAEKKAAFYKDGFAKTHSKDTLDRNWEKHVAGWSGYDEQGNVTNIDELGASMVFDIQKDVMEAANKIGETQGVSVDNIEIKTIPNADGKGTAIAYFDKRTGHRLENTKQIESFTNALINDYTNANTSRGQFSEFTGLKKEDIVKMLNDYMGAVSVDKETIQHTATPINMGAYKVNKGDEYEGHTSAIAEGQRLIADNAKDLNNKIVLHDNTIKTIEASNAPGKQATLAQAKKERRKLKRLDIQAENEAKRNPELIKLGEQVERDSVVFDQKQEKVYQMMADINFEGKDHTEDEKNAYIEEIKSWGPYSTPTGTPEKVRFLYDRLSDARDGVQVEETADMDKLFGRDEYTLLNEMSSLRNSKTNYDNLRDKLKTNFIERQGIEKTSFVSTSTDTEDKFLFNNLKKVLDDKDFNIENIQIADNPDWGGVDLYDAGNDSKYREIRRQAKDLIATSTDQEINFGVNDNGDPVLTITATPKEGGEFNTKYGDKLNDITFTGSNRFKAEIPLTAYNNRNIPELTSYAMHILSSTTLAPSIKNAIIKGIMTANISVSTDKEELGDAAVSANYLGQQAIDNLEEQGYSAIDFYQSPKSNNAPIVTYKIAEDGSKKELVISDIINNKSQKEINTFMADSGVLNLYMDYAENKTMGQFVEDFNKYLPEEYKKEFVGMNDIKVADYLKISEDYIEQDPNGEKLNEFYKLITNLPLLMDTPARIVDIRGAIK
jgi:hypothetical protein